MEILAPVGGREQLTAAVRCGADAVYLGTKLFNARRNAENFGDDDLESAVEYCHQRDVAVHVTVNTLVMDSELEALTQEARRIARSGADAVIVQDLAVAKLFRECCPDISMHASTQLTVHNLSGALMAKDLGFSRIVPARELSLKEIETLAGCGLEIECFVHGALCMCVSGQCYLSAMLGGRSGNRGLCAQPCRLDFDTGSRGYALSLKDMSHIEHIKALENAGVCSLKIEGRMKRPEYVAAAVTACRDALAGREPDIDSLRSVFSRSGFTDGYLTGKRDLSMFGHRTKEDVTASAGVLKSLTGLYRGEFQRLPLDVTVTMAPGEETVLTASDGEYSVTVKGRCAETAITRPTDRDALEKNLKKTGGTPFYLRNVHLNNPHALALAPSEINAIRREALEELLTLRGAPKVKEFISPVGSPLPRYTAPETPEMRLRFEDPQQIPDNCEDRVIFLPVEKIDENVLSRFGHMLMGEMPAVLFPDMESAVKQHLSRLREMGLEHICAGNLGTVKMGLDAGFTVHGGYALNVLNSHSLGEFERLGLADVTVSFEAALKDIRLLRGTLPRGILAYGYLPLMTFRACPIQGKKGCAGCTGKGELTDRLGVKFPVLCHGRQYTTLLNSLPVHLGDKNLKGVDFITLYFTLESKEQCGNIIQDYTMGRSGEGSRTKGLYFRELR